MRDRNSEELLWRLRRLEDHVHSLTEHLQEVDDRQYRILQMMEEMEKGRASKETETEWAEAEAVPDHEEPVEDVTSPPEREAPPPTPEEPWREGPPVEPPMAETEMYPEPPVSRRYMEPRDRLRRRPVEVPERSYRPAPRDEAEISSLEIEMGEKWFQRIGIIALVLAFAFLIAIVVPHLTGEQITGLIFLTAGALAFASERIYMKVQLQMYAKGLEVGAFAIAYIGTWGGAFAYGIPWFPWPSILIGLLVLNIIAAFRYRSPLLSAETGVIYLIAIIAMRAYGIIPAGLFAVLMPAGSIIFALLLLSDRHRQVGLVLPILFAVIALPAGVRADPYGMYMAVPIVLELAFLAHVIRSERFFGLDDLEHGLAYVTMLVLSYCVLYANVSHSMDFALYAMLIVLTAAFTIPRAVSSDRALDLPFMVIVGCLLFPAPFLADRGDVGMLIFPVVVLTMAIGRYLRLMRWSTSTEGTIILLLSFLFAYWYSFTVPGNSDPFRYAALIILTLAFALPRVLSSDRRYDIQFLAVMGFILFPATFVMDRGEVAALFLPLIVSGMAIARASKRIMWFSSIEESMVLLLVFYVGYIQTLVLHDALKYSVFVLLTLAFVLPMLRTRDRRMDLSFVGVIAIAMFPAPLTTFHGWALLTTFPLLLLAFSARRNTKGLAWFVNVVHVSVIVLAIRWVPIGDRNIGTLAWAALLLSMVLHLFLEHRSGYSFVGPRGPVQVPAYMPVAAYILFLPLAFAALIIWAVPEEGLLMPYFIGLILALALNRKAFSSGSQEVCALLVALTGLALGMATAELSWFNEISPQAGNVIAAFHFGVMMFLVTWIGLRVLPVKLDGETARMSRAFSLPALALLTGLPAQNNFMAPLYIVLPVAVAVLAFVFDDAFTFIAAYVAIAIQTAVALLRHGTSATLIGPLLLCLMVIFLFIGAATELTERRRVFGRSTHLTATLLLFMTVVLVIGGSVATTGLWAIIAGTAILWGLKHTFSALRHVGITLFAFVIGKAFIFDLAGQAIEFRVLGLIIVATILLITSYVYATYRKRQEGERRARGPTVPSPKVQDQGELVWYAAYGSNLWSERFRCYIQGGRPYKGSEHRNPGSTNRDPPLDDRVIEIPHELYFAGDSPIWGNGGVAFIRPERTPNTRSFGRMYLLTSDQFLQIVRQENGLRPDDTEIHIDIGQTIADGESIVSDRPYGRVLFLGYTMSHPILTITTPTGDGIVPTVPTEAYLATIVRGLREAHGLEEREIVFYLKEVTGIRGVVPVPRLTEVVHWALQSDRDGR